MKHLTRRLFPLCIVVLATMSGCAAQPAAHDQTADTPNANAAWQRLADGNARFVAAQTQSRELIHRREELVAGQHPCAIVLTCADSRVGPELVFDQSLGDLFVVRNAGNVADPIAIGSVEYAVEHLHCHLIVVLGHTSCGAVNAAMSHDQMPTPNLQAIVDQIRPVLAAMPAGADPVAANVRNTAAELASKSPILAKHLSDGDLTIVMAVYQLKSGRVERLPH